MDAAAGATAGAEEGATAAPAGESEAIVASTGMGPKRARGQFGGQCDARRVVSRQ